MRQKTTKICNRGFFVCNYCSGRGYLFSNAYPVKPWMTRKICPACSGTGQVDWIENATKFEFKKLKFKEKKSWKEINLS